MPRAVVVIAVLVATLLSSLFAVQPLAVAQEATPAGGEACPTSSVDENKAVAMQLIDAMGGSDVDVAALYADDHVFHGMSGEEGPESPSEAAQFLASERRDFPDMSVTVDRLVAEGDMVAFYGSITGTQQDIDEDLGVPATGTRGNWVIARFVRIECGKIAETWVVADRLGRLQDFGVISQEELQSAEAAATPAP